jgi:hypothetical protein
MWDGESLVTGSWRRHCTPLCALSCEHRDLCMAWGQKRALGVPGGPATGGIAKAGRVLPHPGLLGDRWGYPKLFPPALHTLAGTSLYWTDYKVREQAGRTVDL